MTSATTPSLTLVTSFLDHPDARELADQLDGELASIYGGPTTGRDTALPLSTSLRLTACSLSATSATSLWPAAGCDCAGTCRTPS